MEIQQAIDCLKRLMVISLEIKGFELVDAAQTAISALQHQCECKCGAEKAKSWTLDDFPNCPIKRSVIQEIQKYVNEKDEIELYKVLKEIFNKEESQ